MVKLLVLASVGHCCCNAVARGVLWALKNPPPPQSEKGPPKGPLECTKRSTRMYKKVH